MITTDPQDEIFPSVNEKDEVIGKVLRKVANKSPDIIHRAVGILIYNSKGEVLIQKRSPTKDEAPNAWTVSVSGHVDYGASYDETVVREIKEEVGLEADIKDLNCLGKILIRMPHENEFWQVYEYRLSGEPNLKRNKQEITETRFVSIETLSTMLQDTNIEWSGKAREVFKTFL